MREYFVKKENGYTSSIQKGLSAVRSFRSGLSYGTGTREENTERLKRELASSDAVVIGAGAGLSTAAGLTYSGERFERYFFDFVERFHIPDMYSGGFWPFPDEETRWAWWARHIYFNRYIDPPKPVYKDLLALVKDKNYFVITTNVDHQFQRAGFDKKRLFYTQGDYGLFQSASGRIKKTWDNEAWVMLAMEAQGFVRDDSGVFQVPQDRKISMRIPHDLLPEIPEGGKAAMNLRSDDTFVEDAGWQEASANYAAFLREAADKRVLFLEIGAGANTPVIIKYPFWAMTAENPNATYACLNFNAAVCPKQIEDRSICIDGDSAEVLRELNMD
jgi:NAD-dependent SIR2 family protein deacetylase